MWVKVIPMLTVSGCLSVGTGDVYCQRSDKPVREHAAALAEDGGPKSVSTGRTVIAVRDAFCGGSL